MPVNEDSIRLDGKEYERHRDAVIVRLAAELRDDPLQFQYIAMGSKQEIADALNAPRVSTDPNGRRTDFPSRWNSIMAGVPYTNNRVEAGEVAEALTK